MANIKDQVIYIGPNWTIVEDPDDAVMVKVISPDGSIKFGIPVDEDNVDELSELGGPGSGNHGHAGRPGKIGGSSKSSSSFHNYTVKKSNENSSDEELMNIARGVDYDNASRHEELALALYEKGYSKLLEDHDGNIQSFFYGHKSDYRSIEDQYEIPQLDLQDASHNGTVPYIIETLAVSPRNIYPNGERGWGISAVHEAIKEAWTEKCDFIFIHADEDAVGFYKNLGFEEIPYYPSYMIMNDSTMAKFEEKYNG